MGFGTDHTSALTLVLVAVNHALIGVIALADALKDSTPQAVADLRADGVKLVMLTGDRKSSAAPIATQLQIEDVHAEVSPEQKAEIIAGLEREGKIVAMAGDGINDAPALAAADVGIAIGTVTD